jgi:cell division protein FtsL
MRHRRLVLFLFVLLFVAASVVFAAHQFNLSALN